MHDLNLFISENIGILWLLVLLGLVAIGIAFLRHSRAQKQAQQRLQGQLDALHNALRQSLLLLPTRTELQQSLQDKQEQTGASLNALYQHLNALSMRFDGLGASQEQRLDSLTSKLDSKLTQNEQRIERMRETLENSVGKLQTENSQKLDEMRKTVDEKLHDTLNRRLGESFSEVSSRLEQVHKGLGEMQALASGVGDLKRVLTNVKTRGVWGEMQLGMLLEQVLAPNQYDENVAVVPGSAQRVEYAIKLPGQGKETVYLPIDAKFPLEDYERLLAANETTDAAQMDAAAKALQNALRIEGKRIHDKYIAPPHTTDFAIMFLPIEGLYAEALRCRGLAEEMQEKLRIVLAGPTTLTAILNSLNVGFRTLAIEKRSSEVWQLLGAVKTEFAKYGDLLEAAHKKVESVGKTLDDAARKTRTIERRLRSVETLDSAEAAGILGVEEPISLLDMTDEL